MTNAPEYETPEDEPTPEPVEPPQPEEDDDPEPDRYEDDEPTNRRRGLHKAFLP